MIPAKSPGTQVIKPAEECENLSPFTFGEVSHMKGARVAWVKSKQSPSSAGEVSRIVYDRILPERFNLSQFSTAEEVSRIHDPMRLILTQ